MTTGRASDALVHFRRGVEGDPLNLVHRKYLDRALHYARHITEATAVLREAMALDANFPGLHYELGRSGVSSTAPGLYRYRSPPR